jgi:hypothetical protein
MCFHENSGERTGEVKPVCVRGRGLRDAECPAVTAGKPENGNGLTRQYFTPTTIFNPRSLSSNGKHRILDESRHRPQSKEPYVRGNFVNEWSQNRRILTNCVIGTGGAQPLRL